MNDTRYPSLTLYLEDWPGDLEKSGDLAVWCRITIFNQGGCGEDQQFTHTGTAHSFLSWYNYASHQNAYDLGSGKKNIAS